MLALDHEQGGMRPHIFEEQITKLVGEISASYSNYREQSPVTQMNPEHSDHEIRFILKQLYIDYPELKYVLVRIELDYYKSTWDAYQSLASAKTDLVDPIAKGGYKIRRNAEYDGRSGSVIACLLSDPVALLVDKNDSDLHELFEQLQENKDSLPIDIIGAMTIAENAWLFFRDFDTEDPLSFCVQVEGEYDYLAMRGVVLACLAKLEIASVADAESEWQMDEYYDILSKLNSTLYFYELLIAKSNGHDIGATPLAAGGGDVPQLRFEGERFNYLPHFMREGMNRALGFLGVNQDLKIVSTGFIPSEIAIPGMQITGEPQSRTDYQYVMIKQKEAELAELRKLMSGSTSSGANNDEDKITISEAVYIETIQEKMPYLSHRSLFSILKHVGLPVYSLAMDADAKQEDRTEYALNIFANYFRQSQRPESRYIARLFAYGASMGADHNFMLNMQLWGEERNYDSSHVLGAVLSSPATFTKMIREHNLTIIESALMASSLFEAPGDIQAGNTLGNIEDRLGYVFSDAKLDHKSQALLGQSPSIINTLVALGVQELNLLKGILGDPVWNTMSITMLFNYLDPMNYNNKDYANDIWRAIYKVSETEVFTPAILMRLVS